MVLGRKSWAANRIARAIASFRLKLRSANMMDASNDCADVSSSSSVWRASRGNPRALPSEIAYAIGIAPTSRVHWLTFDDTRAPIPTEPRSLSANRTATTNSGDSEARGAIHCTRRNSSTS